MKLMLTAVRFAVAGNPAGDDLAIDLEREVPPRCGGREHTAVHPGLARGNAPRGRRRVVAPRPPRSCLGRAKAVVTLAIGRGQHTPATQRLNRWGRWFYPVGMLVNALAALLW